MKILVNSVIALMSLDATIVFLFLLVLWFKLLLHLGLPNVAAWVKGWSRGSARRISGATQAKHYHTYQYMSSIWKASDPGIMSAQNVRLPL